MAAKAELSAKLALKEKLLGVYAIVDHVDKAGHNKTQNYNYVKSVDVTREVRKALLAARVYAEINFDFQGPSYEIKRAKEPLAPFTAVNVKCSVVFHDLDSEVTLTGSGLGTGADNSDKAVYKAQTGALKYALKNAFLIPDEADPEADETVDDRGGVNNIPEDIPDFAETATRGNVKPNNGKPPEKEQPKPAEKQAEPKADPTPASKPVQAPAAEATTQTSTATVQPSPASLAPAAAEREPGDEPTEAGVKPSEEQLDGYRKRFKELGDELSAKGGLKSSKGLPINIKLKAFLLSITKADNPAQITTAQWNAFFDRVDKARENPDCGVKGITKLVNKANGIEDQK